MNDSRVQAVIFDLSGTVIDFGSRGPVLAFVELFRRHGLAVTEEEARRPMGSHKWDHIMSVLQEARVRELWIAAKGRAPGAADVDAMYPEFTAIQIETLAHHSAVLPGVAETVAELGRRGIRYASTTGFDSGMMAHVKASAEAGGFHPEVFLCPDLVGGGRPAPWMIYQAAKQMGLYPLRTFVKVGDTPIDIAEAQAAGTWAVSVVRTGNEIGLSEAALAALEPEERERRAAAAREKFLGLGAHYVIDSVADLPPVLDEINVRLARGERP